MESVKLKQQVDAWEEKAQYYQKKFEDAQALCEEASRQKKRFQELAERAPGSVNLEVRYHYEHYPPLVPTRCSLGIVNVQYLRNVMIKYIESHNASEKARLVPVIGTVLQFSPVELQRVQAAHSSDESGSGLLGGVFSLFGSSAPSPPKPLATPPNYRPSTKHVGPTGVLDEDEDEEAAASSLNPFAL